MMDPHGKVIPLSVRDNIPYIKINDPGDKHARRYDNEAFIINNIFKIGEEEGPLGQIKDPDEVPSCTIKVGKRKRRRHATPGEEADAEDEEDGGDVKIIHAGGDEDGERKEVPEDDEEDTETGDEAEPEDAERIDRELQVDVVEGTATGEAWCAAACAQVLRGLVGGAKRHPCLYSAGKLTPRGMGRGINKLTRFADHIHIYSIHIYVGLSTTLL